MEAYQRAYSIRAEMLKSPKKWVIALLMTIIFFFMFAFFWAMFAELDEVTTGRGRIVPSSKIQLVQNLEGGLVADILVKEGDFVEKGQLLLRISDIVLSSSERENRARYLGFLATSSRLKSEVENRDLTFPEVLKIERPDLVASEERLYNSRKDEFESSLAILDQQKEQREQELSELKSREKHLVTGYELANEEAKMLAPLVQSGVASKVELLRIKRDVNQLESDLAATRANIKRAESALIESDRRISERKNNFQAEALSQLNEIMSRQLALKEALTAAEDRVTRTNVVSPVPGVVKQLLVNTIGQVIKPGENILEIVPIEDTLLVEAEVLPKDIAFLSPGQDAIVKLTAYDFLIYGGLKAKLEKISPDTIVDEKGDRFFVIQLRTNTSFLEKEGVVLPIKPGMVVDVDVLTGKKTVLQYLLKPITRARHVAMRER